MGKEKRVLTRRSSILTALANKIHKTNLTEKEILSTLYNVWDIAKWEGYEKRLNEGKKLRTLREATHKKEWGKQRDKIEDMINGGLKPKID